MLRYIYTFSALGCATLCIIYRYNYLYGCKIVFFPYTLQRQKSKTIQKVSSEILVFPIIFPFNFGFYFHIFKIKIKCLPLLSFFRPDLSQTFAIYHLWNCLKRAKIRKKKKNLTTYPHTHRYTCIITRCVYAWIRTRPSAKSARTKWKRRGKGYMSPFFFLVRVAFAVLFVKLWHIIIHQAHKRRVTRALNFFFLYFRYGDRMQKRDCLYRCAFDSTMLARVKSRSYKRWSLAIRIF